MKYLMLLTVLMSFNAMAEITSDDLALADEAIQAPTIDLEGQYKVKEVAVHEAAVVAKPAPAPAPIIEAPKPKRLSQSDKLKLYRERLEERNRIMMERKIEQIRYKQEVALARQLEQSMNQTLKAIESIK